MNKIDVTNKKEKTALAGLVVEKHRLALGNSQGALASLGAYYLGNKNWKLPRNATIKYVGYDKADHSDDWVLTLNDEINGPQIYFIWSVEL